MRRTPRQDFVDVLPLVRRTFGSFCEAERRAIGGPGLRGAARAPSGADDDSTRTRGRGAGHRGDDPGGAVASERGGPGRRVRRWRLLLGGAAQEPLGAALGKDEAAMDAALARLYDQQEAARRDGPRPAAAAGLGGSAPRVARWLGDIRTYFPSSVVQVMQRDALERLQPDPAAARARAAGSRSQPDVHLVGTLRQPQPGHAGARPGRPPGWWSARWSTEIERRLAQPTRAAVTGALDRAARTRRPRPRDIDWNRTIAANLRHYQPEHRTVVPERLVGYGRSATGGGQRTSSLAIDQSGSMAESVVYASVFGAVLASLRVGRAPRWSPSTPRWST